MPLFVFGLHSTELISYIVYSWHYVIMLRFCFYGFLARFSTSLSFSRCLFRLLFRSDVINAWDSLMQWHAKVRLHFGPMCYFPGVGTLVSENAFIYLCFDFCLSSFMLNRVACVCAWEMPKGYMCVLFRCGDIVKKRKCVSKLRTMHTHYALLCIDYGEVK